MISSRAFFLTVALSFVLLLPLQGGIGSDPFNAQSDRTLKALEALPEQDITALKLDHARHVERYDIGLFGNSRSIQAGSDKPIGDSRSFFNFSVPGASFRNSVAMIETLADDGALPKTVLVSLDNFAIDFYGNALFPEIGTRWATMFEDVLADGVLAGQPIRAVLRMAFRHALTEWRILTSQFNVTLLRNRLLGSAEAANGPAALYRANGSRALPPVRRNGDLVPVKTEYPKQIIRGYLAADLRRLSDIAEATDSRIVVFESPVAPGLEVASAGIDDVRASFYALCGRLQVTCLPAPDLGEYPLSAWFDATHAPTAALDTWLTTVLAKAAP